MDFGPREIIIGVLELAIAFKTLLSFWDFENFDDGFIDFDSLFLEYLDKWRNEPYMVFS